MNAISKKKISKKIKKTVKSYKLKKIRFFKKGLCIKCQNWKK